MNGQCAGLCAGHTLPGIDVDMRHRSKVQHEAVVADAQASAIVSAAAYCKRKLMHPCELQCARDIVGAGAANDERRVLVDRAVEDEASAGIVVVARSDDASLDRGLELSDECRIELTAVSLRRRRPAQGV